MPDAVVIGAGPNGLVAANLLADAGWDVTVLEAADEPGGAVSSAGYLGNGLIADVCSAFYPLAAASPVIDALGLEDHGLRWCRAPAVLAHPLPDGRAALLWPDVDDTARHLDSFGPGDGGAWKELFALWQRTEPGLIRSLFTPFPPVRGSVALASELGPAGLLRFARFALLPVRRLAEETFHGPAGPALLAGCTLHTDLAPESAGGTAYGWALAMLGQRVGFPVPEGGAGQLTAALVRRFSERGGRLVCASAAKEVEVNRGHASAVVTVQGERVSARRAVLADVSATALYGGLVSWDKLPERLRADVARFAWDNATVKLDWAVEGGIPWAAPDVGRAGTVHLGGDLDDMTRYAAQLAQGKVPARPFVLVGQMTTADPTRSPPGIEVVWAYTHVPSAVRGDAGDDGIRGVWDDADREAIAARLEARVEGFAPGFRSRIRARHLACPPDLEAHDANLVGGALNGGTSALHQQMLFRPVPGLGGPDTPVAGLYLASASAHPGGGVHGACGANAARAALGAAQPFGRLLGRPVRRASERLARGY
jgi:phytoene dehydrogenase-like protein